MDAHLTVGSNNPKA